LVDNFVLDVGEGSIRLIFEGMDMICLLFSQVSMKLVHGALRSADSIGPSMFVLMTHEKLF
jgi:hypothetical protein